MPLNNQYKNPRRAPDRAFLLDERRRRRELQSQITVWTRERIRATYTPEYIEALFRRVEANRPDAALPGFRGEELAGPNVPHAESRSVLKWR